MTGVALVASLVLYEAFVILTAAVSGCLPGPGLRARSRPTTSPSPSRRRCSSSPSSSTPR
ncbi:MAG: hypothetical protein MZW92_68860 [Comamonadaceae bacterium]|nr:hypothetical protein [Comamonadaceae bacterium]